MAVALSVGPGGSVLFRSCRYLKSLVVLENALPPSITAM